MVMNVPPNLSARNQKFSCVGTIHVILLADGPFHQDPAACQRRKRIVLGRAAIRFLLEQICDRMMRNPPARHRSRSHFHGSNPASFCQRNRCRRFPPLILTDSRHRVRIGFDHQVRLAILFCKLPFLFVAPLLRRRHIFRIPHRRPRVHPLDDLRDLFIRQRSIVLELLNADSFIQMPGRHLPGCDAFLDRLGPRPHFVISDQRHRRHRFLAMASLAFFLENRRDIFGEGDGFGSASGGR